MPNNNERNYRRNNNREKDFSNILKMNSDESHLGKKAKTDINKLFEGDYFKGVVKILRLVKPGPIIMNVFDGTGTIEAIIHDKVFRKENISQPEIGKIYDFGNLTIKDNRKKKKSTSKDSDNENEESIEDNTPIKEEDLKVDASIEIYGRVEMRREKLEIQVISLKRSSLNFDKIIELKSKPIRDSFSIKSERYESMKSRFLAIAQRIRLAIIEQQPILIRHHNDADGICAGLAIEQAILNVMERKSIEPKNLLRRRASPSPFYDQIDLFKDISRFMRFSETFGDLSPLVLLLDTGSTPENHFPLQVLESFEFECIIVDHHNPGEIIDGKSSVCDLLKYHLNPYLFGWDSQTCGGMLSYELARFIDENYEQKLYPAVAGLADRCDVSELDLLIEESGKPREYLIKIGQVLDYLAYNFKFDSGDAVYDKVFINEKFLNAVSNKVSEYLQSSLDSILPILKSKMINGVCYTELDLDMYTQRGKYPTAGRVLGMGHDHIKVKPENEGIPVITAGIFSDGIIFRASEPVLPVPDLLKKLQAELPLANVEGGGHEQAGAIKFLPAYFEIVHKFILNELKSLEIN